MTHVVETAPPAGEVPTEWRLLTTLDVRTAKDAAEVVGYYLQRWRIEDFFRVLKSGCRTESLLFRTADRLQRAVAVNAWRIMVTALLGRQVMWQGQTRLGSAAMGHRIGSRPAKGTPSGRTAALSRCITCHDSVEPGFIIVKEFDDLSQSNSLAVLGSRMRLAHPTTEKLLSRLTSRLRLQYDMSRSNSMFGKR